MIASRTLALLLAAILLASMPAAAAPPASRLAQAGETPEDEPGAVENGDPAAEEGETPPGARPDEAGGSVPGKAGSRVASPADDGPSPQIETDLSKLPFPVRRMRELLVEAARSGDIERLRPFVGDGDDVTLFSFGTVGGDPIEFLRSSSGDTEGHEILAILLEVLEAGYVHVEPGTENELFIWPYFYGVQLDRLTPPQRVELFKLLTFGDYEDMLSFGAYIFYRVGITPAGRWRFFVAGD